MEVFILDNFYRRQSVIETFESFIWTERFSAYGDFELHMYSTLENRSLLSAGTKIAHSETYRVMTVQTVENTTDDQGKAMLKITGTSLEKILDNRVARGTLGDLTTTPKWSLTGLPKAIAQQMFHDICVTGILDAGDIIPGINESSIFPVDTIAAPSDSVTYEPELTTLYLAMKNLCDIYSMGFRLVRDGDTSQLYFDIYMGSDRTTGQTTLPAVVFSPGLDNLKNTTEITTTALYKNVAYVFSPVGHEIVYALDVDPAVEGFDRQILVVKADDITDTTPSVASAKMIQRGKDELSKARKLFAFDGEISQSIQYKYGVDYNLGDLVELQNEDGVTTNVQVTEQIFVSDSEGERSYPTLTVYRYITPGSWAGWDYNKEWDDYDSSSTTWSEQP
jgi:hypothetical protein